MDGIHQPSAQAFTNAYFGSLWQFTLVCRGCYGLASYTCAVYLPQIKKHGEKHVCVSRPLCASPKRDDKYGNFIYTSF